MAPWYRVGLLTLWLLAGGTLQASAAGGAPAPNAAGGRPAPPAMDPGCDSIEIRLRLARVDAAVVSRACGNITWPWAYRGPAGRHVSMSRLSQTHASREWAQAVANSILEGAYVDSARNMRSTNTACDPYSGAAIYVVEFFTRKSSTLALFRFDLGVVVLFTGEQPLGMIPMDGRADSLWTALGERLVEDRPLRGRRPAIEPPARSASAPAESVFVQSVPEPVTRVYAPYPDRAREKGVQGTVWTNVLVGVDGTVRDAIVIQGPPGLRDAALEAVWQWVFKPASANGEPVAVWVGIPFKFTLH